MKDNWEIIRGTSPLIAAAIHAGHSTRKDVSDLFALNDNDRLTEEDPYTDILTDVTDNRIIVNTSRFELDVNRPRDKAVYIKPEDAWGLQIWKETSLQNITDTSLKNYDKFYEEVFSFIREVGSKHKEFCVFDLHTYNHMRNGVHAAESENPEVNLGTGTIQDRNKWKHVINTFIDVFRENGFDVRENVKFKGGEFSRKINSEFADQGVALAIEFKKTFMNEKNGELYKDNFDKIHNTLHKAANAVKSILK